MSALGTGTSEEADENSHPRARPWGRDVVEEQTGAQRRVKWKESPVRRLVQQEDCCPV